MPDTNVVDLAEYRAKKAAESGESALWDLLGLMLTEAGRAEQQRIAARYVDWQSPDLRLENCLQRDEDEPA